MYINLKSYRKLIKFKKKIIILKRKQMMNNQDIYLLRD